MIHQSEHAKQKIEKIISDGASMLYVVSDFDGTMTFEYDSQGKRQPSNVALIRESGLLSAEYSKQAHELFDYYHKYEIDQDLPLQDKKDLMHEWWSKHIKLLIDSGLNQQIIDTVSAQNQKLFRPLLLETLQILNQFNIPTIVFSAGIGNIVDKLLEFNSLNFSNVHTISNYYSFDELGKATQVGEIIHSFNKDETILAEASFGQYITNRKNVIVLGNGLGDASMVADIDHEIVLRIAFLDKPNASEAEIKGFLEFFDIVLTEQADFSLIKGILEQI